jgi:methyl-accepting chemotaxis protein
LGSEQRKLKNVYLTSKYHWPYVGGWLIVNIFLTIVVEGLILASLHTVSGTYTKLPISKYATISSLVGVIVIIGLSALAMLWAHRIAGVHIRTETVFNKIAQGDRTIQLRYRASDQLEDVEEAFDRMMTSLAEREDGSLAEPGKAETPKSRDRRSWKNMQLTSKYHFSYMAVWLLVSIGLLMATYASTVFYLYLRHYVVPSSSLNLNLVFGVLSVVVLALGAFTIWRGFQTAHRLAGVHIKLIQTFDRVAGGEGGVELRFRSSDKLEHLETAFQAMMESLQHGPEDEDVDD